jgi:hypothetical protein
MPQNVSDANSISPAGKLDRLDRLFKAAVDVLTPRRILVLIFLLTIALMFMYRPLSQTELGDSALYDYIAQSIVRGQIPYRDIVDIKAPGSFYLSAIAMEAGRAVGVRDILAARLLHVLMMGLLSVVVFVVGDSYLRNRFAAVLSVLFLLTSQSMALWTVGGGQPKLPMILFGMVTLLLIAKDRPFWAGVSSMLACLCWQPGLLFTGVAILMFSRYLTTWRDLRALKVLAGALIPLAVTLLYFQWRGALDEFWTWTVVFNYSVYARNAAGAEGTALMHALNVSLKIFGLDVILVALSLIGFVWFGIQRIRERFKSGGVLQSPGLFRDAIIIVPLVYFAACAVRFNGGPYLMPFFPFIGMFFGWFVVEMYRLLKTKMSRSGLNHTSNADWLARAIVVVMLGLIAYRAIEYRLFEYVVTLQTQDKTFEAISSRLSDSDSIYVHGTSELLVLLNRPNLNPYILLDWGKDDYIAAKDYGGSFAAIVDEIKTRSPKVIGLTRLQRVRHRDELSKLVENYERLELKYGYEFFVKKKE